MNNIDYETVISSFDDKGTLLKWLKTIDAELKGSKVISSSWRVVEGEESNTAYLTLTTSDGVNFETEGLRLPKVNSAIIIDVINQAIEIYDQDYGGSTTLQEFIEATETRITAVENNRGTKLYKHDISVYNNKGNINFYVLSTSSLPLTLNNLENGLVVLNNNIISISSEQNVDAWLFNPYNVYIGQDIVHAVLCDCSTTIETTTSLQGDNVNFTDTVTPL